MEGLDAIAYGRNWRKRGGGARILRGLEWIGVRMNPDANHARKVAHADSSKIAGGLPAERKK